MREAEGGEVKGRASRHELRGLAAIDRRPPPNFGIDTGPWKSVRCIKVCRPNRTYPEMPPDGPTAAAPTRTAAHMLKIVRIYIRSDPACYDLFPGYVHPSARGKASPCGQPDDSPMNMHALHVVARFRADPTGDNNSACDTNCNAWPLRPMRDEASTVGLSNHPTQRNTERSR